MNKRKNMISWLITTALIITAAVPMTFDTESAQAVSKKLPKKFDLRTKGLVTPVKSQDPFGSCWAFGGIAAAEISLLKAAKTTYKKTKLDLSEKHIAWFAMHPITKQEERSQAGEGMVPMSAKGNDIYDIGGNVSLISTVFSSGSGPLPEDLFPYRGKKGLTDYDAYKQNESKIKNNYKDAFQSIYDFDKKDGESFVDYIKRTEGITVSGIDEYVDNKYKKDLADSLDPYENGYSNEDDDWSLDARNKKGDSNRSIYTGWTLKDGNVLPPFSLRTKKNKWKGINKAGTKAVKNELMKGHGVAVSFLADQSQPGGSNTGKYIDLNTWAHYTYKDSESNHTVCIVGWDDNYSKKNFNKGHRPPGNGAWIVKNSWGCETPDAIQKSPKGHVINKAKWGVKNNNGLHTGYFYISYYDKSLEEGESMEFNQDFEKGKGFFCTQYDYMPAMELLKLKSKNKIKTANIFKGEAKSKLKSVSATTTVENSKVLFEVYKLKKNAKNPTKGKKIRSFSRKFPYSGFHRTILKKKVKLKKGERYSVVTTEYFKNKGKRTYTTAVSCGISKKAAKEIDFPCYCKAVVNKGESYIYKNGKWHDWKSYRKQKSIAKRAYNICGSNAQIDNFAIKAYCVK